MSDDGRGFARIHLDDVEPCDLDDVVPRDLDDVEPTLPSVGYELRPGEMRQSVWRFEPGASTTHHRHEALEDLYVVFENRFDVRVGDDEFTVGEGDYLVAEPDAWRQLTASDGGLLLVVGAPPVEDDAVQVGVYAPMSTATAGCLFAVRRRRCATLRQPPAGGHRD